VMVMDEAERVTLSNPEARRLLGVQSEQFESLAEVPRWGLEKLQTILRTCTQSTADNECCAGGPGAQLWLAARTCKLAMSAVSERSDSDAASHPQATILILRDVTGQKKLDDERERARNVVALAEMSAVLAHEIRNPLASLELFAGLIGRSGEGSQAYVTHLQAGIRTLSATVNNVLRFHSGGAMQLARMSLADSLNDAVGFVQPLAEQRQIQVSLQVGPEDLPIHGDHDALQQVFLNLALNAFRHTTNGGRLWVTASRVTGGAKAARVEFSDNGCGIEPTLLARIFDPGCSGIGYTPGLGLAVCRRIVEQHGGSIRLSSELGRGTTVSLEFPIES